MTKELTALLGEALGTLDVDGGFSPSVGAKVRGLLEDIPDGPVELDHPAELLGPWDDLPPAAQTALLRLIEADIKGTLDRHPRGRMWPSASLILNTLADYTRRFPSTKPLASGFERLSGIVWEGPTVLGDRARFSRRLKDWRRGRTSIQGLLAVLGRGSSWLLGDYVRGVDVDPRARGFYQDVERNVVWGYLTGIDLIPTPRGVQCVEANLNTGAYQQEYRHLWDARGALERVFSFAKDLGMKTVWWHGMDWSPTSPWLKATLEEEARSKGLDVVIRQDYRAPLRKGYPKGVRRPKRRLFSPRRPPRDTLVVRRNSYGIGSDFLLNDKDSFSRSVGSALRGSGRRECFVPTMTRTPETLHPGADEGLPNLVYKYPDSGKGKGVFFMKVRTQDQAVALARQLDQERGRGPGLFQPFHCSRLLPGRRVYDVRCEVLLTPMGSRRVLGVRREAASSIPETLPDGLVSSVGVFTANMSTGGDVAPLTDQDLSEIEGATEAIAWGLTKALEETFTTSG